MPAVTFNLNRVLSSAGSGLVFTLGLTAADYTAAVVAEQTQSALSSTRHYAYLNTPAVSGKWARGAVTDAQASAYWAKFNTLDALKTAAWSRAVAVDYTLSAPWGRAAPVDAPSLVAKWGAVLALDVAAGSVSWAATRPYDVQAATLRWSRAVTVDADSCAIRWTNLPPLDRSATSVKWGAALATDISASVAYLEGPALDSEQIGLPWRVAYPVVDYLIPTLPNPGEPELPPSELQKGRGFACFHLGRSRQSTENVYNLNRRINNDACYAGSFIVNNTFSATTIADGLPLEVTSFSAETNEGSNAWDFTLGLPRLAELNRIKPTASGPIEVECILNGYTFRMVVESYDESRAHGSWGYSATA